jgi:uncharacterized cupredoxin-like copper-binding protein
MDRSGSNVSRARSIATLVGVALVAAVALSSCGQSSAGAGAARGTLLRVSEQNFHIGASAATVRAGTVTLRVHNAGPDRHELIVLPLHRGEAIGRLPLRRDGFTVDEELLQNQEPGSITPQQPGHTEDVTVNLAPGRYVLFCNMEGHYMAGMQTELVVAG